jgi:pimeloyl-ACP methyl ester carboxylesterase
MVAVARRHAHTPWCRHLLAGVLAAGIGCAPEERPVQQVHPVEVPSQQAEPAKVSPVEVVPFDVPNDVPAFLLKGATGTTMRMVFLHGRCTHAQGYVQAFQFAANKRGSVVAPQGDVVCDGAFRRWTPDPVLQDRRIEAAFRAAGDDGELSELVVIGYSQGEYLAEKLLERFPKRYTRAVLMGAPSVPSVQRLRGLRGAVMISGELDSRDLMKQGARLLQSVGVPAIYMEMPGARHAQIVDGERVMEDALSWLTANERPQ